MKRYIHRFMVVALVLATIGLPSVLFTTPAYADVATAPVLTTGTITPSSVVLQWTSVPNTTGYRIYRSSAASDGVATLLDTVNNTTYTDNSALPNNKYTYYVTPVIYAPEGPGNPGTSSNTVSATTPASPVLPSAPVVMAGPVLPTSVGLQWPTVPNANNYTVYRNNGFGDYTMIGTTAGTNFTDNNVSPNSSYNYEVMATNSNGNGPQSAPVYVQTPSPSAPSIQLTGVLGSSGQQVQLTWTSYPNATGYRLMRNGVVLADNLPVSPLSYNDNSGLQPNTPYTYSVQPKIPNNDSGTTYGPLSNLVTVMTSAATTPTATTSNPTSTLPVLINLTATAKSASQIDLMWDPAPGALEYNVYRSEGVEGNYMPIGKARSTTAPDTNLKPSTKYYYYVVAVTPNGEIPQETLKSNVASATTLAVPTTTNTPAYQYPATSPSTTSNSTNNSGYQYPSYSESSYPAPGTSLKPGSTVSTADACGQNDTLSPARIVDPNSDIKFPHLPRTAVFRPGASFPFTYCYKSPATRSIKIVRSLYDSQNNLVGTQVVGRRSVRNGQIVSLTPTQVLGRTLVQGNYQVRIQIVDETPVNLGDEPIPADKLVADNGFIVSVITDPSLIPSNQFGTGSYLVPQNASSMINFPFFSKRNTYRPGETLRLPVTYKNSTGSVKHLTVEYRLVNSSGTTITTQTQSATLGANRTATWSAAQPLLTGLSTGQYTFMVVVSDKDTGQQLDSNSFSFMLSI